MPGLAWADRQPVAGQVTVPLAVAPQVTERQAAAVGNLLGVRVPRVVPVAEDLTRLAAAQRAAERQAG